MSYEGNFHNEASQADGLDSQAFPELKAMDPAVLFDAAFSMASAIDRGQVDDLWDGGSAAMKQLVDRDQFGETIARTRDTLGIALSRDWTAIHRKYSVDGGLPYGQYVSVEFMTYFSRGRTIPETVVYRLDEDGAWRLAAYVVRT
jgi:uncharacterized protein DUF4019